MALLGFCLDRFLNLWCRPQSAETDDGAALREESHDTLQCMDRLLECQGIILVGLQAFGKA